MTVSIGMKKMIDFIDYVIDNYKKTIKILYIPVKFTLLFLEHSALLGIAGSRYSNWKFSTQIGHFKLMKL